MDLLKELLDLQKDMVVFLLSMLEGMFKLLSSSNKSSMRIYLCNLLTLVSVLKGTLLMELLENKWWTCWWSRQAMFR